MQPWEYCTAYCIIQKLQEMDELMQRIMNIAYITSALIK